MKTHTYQVDLEWTGNAGAGTKTYQSYNREHVIRVKGKPELLCSSDPAFRGDPARHNPEEMLVMALSSCHMLWYFHVCMDAGVIVTRYEDAAIGYLDENADGSGQFREVILKPKVQVAKLSMLEKALALHEKANSMCFISRSCNFPVKHEPEVNYR